MLRSAKELYQYTLQATDGEIGQVNDFYFDDHQWGLRYVVVKTGNWLFGRKVLISPVVLGRPDSEMHKLPVTLTKEQVETSPDLKLEKSISRQQTANLHTHYDWPPLERMGGGLFDEQVIGMDSDSIVETIQARMRAVEETAGADTHLHSSNEVRGYTIQALDGEIGHIEDFIFDDNYWTVYYLVVDTGSWLSGRKVVVSPMWIDEIHWPGGQVFLNLKQEAVKHSPEYDPSALIDRAYETRLYEHYERPTYWD